jgi:hypothetical protein
LRKAKVVAVVMVAVAAVAAVVVHRRAPVSIAVWGTLRIVPAVARMMDSAMRRPDRMVVRMTDSIARDVPVQTCVMLMTICKTIRICRVRCIRTPTIFVLVIRQPSRRIPI